MRENEAIRLLEAVLTREGAEWREESGWVRFRLRHGAAVWETACRAQKDALLLYGRFPFRCGDPDRAGRLCAEINRQLVRGAVFGYELDGGKRQTWTLESNGGTGKRLNTARAVFI